MKLRQTGLVFRCWWCRGGRSARGRSPLPTEARRPARAETTYTRSVYPSTWCSNDGLSVTDKAVSEICSTCVGTGAFAGGQRCARGALQSLRVTVFGAIGFRTGFS